MEQTENLAPDPAQQQQAENESAIAEAVHTAEPEQPKKKRVAEYFSAKKIATLGVLCALSYVVALFDFPIFPSTTFLKLDFGNVFIMLAGFLYGPVEGVIVCVIKELLHIPLGSTGGVGEVANMIMTTAFLLLPATLYRFKKGIKVVIPSLVGATVLMSAASLLVNRYINYPLFMGDGAAVMFAQTWYFVLAFNLIKGVVISALTCMLYKTLSRVLKKL